MIILQSIIAKRGTTAGKYGWIDGEPEIGIKVLAKLSNESCSIGLNDASIVTYDGTNTNFFKEISEKYNNSNLMVQEFISGLEVEVPFVNSSSIYVFEPLGISVEGNIKLGDKILDFFTRNSGGKFNYYDFAALHADLSNNIKEEVAKVAKLLGIEGIGRIDFRITQDLSRYCITDINCNPHITKTMSVYKAMQKLGFVEYIDTLELLIGSALDRMSESKKEMLAKDM